MSSRGVAAARAACEGFHGGQGNFLGIWSLLLSLLLHFIYRFVQCKMQKQSRKQEAVLPPATPLDVLANRGLLFQYMSVRQKPAGVINFAAQCHGFDRRGG